jgi:hypothetical protein
MFVDIRDLPATEKTDAFVRSIPHGNRLSATLGQLYLWIYWISQRSKALYFGLSACLGGLPRRAKPLWRGSHSDPNFSSRLITCLAIVIFQVRIVHVEAGGLP